MYIVNEQSCIKTRIFYTYKAQPFCKTNKYHQHSERAILSNEDKKAVNFSSLLFQQLFCLITREVCRSTSLELSELLKQHLSYSDYSMFHTIRCMFLLRKYRLQWSVSEANHCDISNFKLEIPKCPLLTKLCTSSPVHTIPQMTQAANLQTQYRITL